MFRITPDVLTTAAQATGGDRNIRVLDGPPCTDGHNVYLPGIKPRLTTTEALILRGYFDHEVAHIRYGSFRPIRLAASKPSQEVHNMFNAVEDLRIEACSKAELPGTIGPINAINAACLGADRSNSAPMTAFDQTTHAILWYGMGVGPDRADYLPEGWAVIAAMDLAEFDAFLLDIDNKSAQGSLDIARRLSAAARKVIGKFNDAMLPKPNADVGMPMPGDSDGGDDGNGDGNGDGSGDDGQPGDGDGGSGDDGQSDDGQSGDSDDGQSGDGDGDGQPGDSDGGGQPGRGGWVASSNESPGVSSKADGLKAIEDKDARRYTRLETQERSSAINKAAKVEWAYTGNPLERVSFEDIHSNAMQISRSLRDRLMSNDRTHWGMPRESGHRIDRRMMAGVASGQSLNAFNRRKVDRAIKTKVTILLDGSGSMSVNYRTAKKAAWTIADATETLGCPTEVLGFTEEVQLIKAPGRVTGATKMRGSCCGGTSMLPALLRERVAADAYPSHRRVVFIVTDGQTLAPKPCIEFIKGQQDAGVTYFAICLDMIPKRVHEACDHVMSIKAEDLMGTMHASLRSL